MVHVWRCFVLCLRATVLGLELVDQTGDLALLLQSVGAYIHQSNVTLGVPELLSRFLAFMEVDVNVDPATTAAPFLLNYIREAVDPSKYAKHSLQQVSLILLAALGFTHLERAASKTCSPLLSLPPCSSPSSLSCTVQRRSACESSTAVDGP